MKFYLFKVRLQMRQTVIRGRYKRRYTNCLLANVVLSVMSIKNGISRVAHMCRQTTTEERKSLKRLLLLRSHRIFFVAISRIHVVCLLCYGILFSKKYIFLFVHGKQFSLCDRKSSLLSVFHLLLKQSI